MNKGNIEIVLKRTLEGFLIYVYIRVNKYKLELIDFNFFENKNNLSLKRIIELNASEIEELYTGVYYCDAILDYNSIKNAFNIFGFSKVKLDIEENVEFMSNQSEMDFLNKKLKESIDEEDYLMAAQLRDQIIEIKKQREL